MAVAARLLHLGLSAPEVYRFDSANGLLLLEDFGDDTFTPLLERGEDENRLYLLAANALMTLQREPDAADGFSGLRRGPLRRRRGTLPRLVPAGGGHTGGGSGRISRGYAPGASRPCWRGRKP